MSVDRNAILGGLITSFSAYSLADARPTVEKVLKYSGGNSDLSRRADIRHEIVLFRLQGGTTLLNVGEEKPTELRQNFEVLVYVEQGESHSIKEARYNRLLEISDQVMDWSTVTGGSSIDSDVLTITLLSVGSVLEQNGFLSTTLSYQSIINLQ